MVLINDPLIDFIQYKTDNIGFSVSKLTFEANIFKSEKPYEGMFCSYFNFIQDNNDKIYGYYRCVPKVFTHDCLELYENQYLGVIESNDGIEFYRPILNIVNFNNEIGTNLVLKGHCCHAFFVFIDPIETYGFKYKGFARTLSDKTHNLDEMELWGSSDTKKWTKIRSVISKQNYELRDFRNRINFDTLNNIIYDHFRKCYHIFLRFNKGPGVRVIHSLTSFDLINWSSIKFINLHNKPYNIYVPNINMYPNSPFFLGLSTYQHLNNPYTKYVSIIFSRDGSNWINIMNNSNLLPDLPKPIIGASGIINTSDKFLFYFEHFFKCKVDAYSVPLHRLTYFENKEITYGILKTKFINLLSNKIFVNCELYAQGSLEISICDNVDNILYTSEIITTGDYPHTQIKWKQNTNTPKLLTNIYLLINITCGKLFNLMYDLDFPTS